MDGVADGAPAVQWRLQPEFLRRTHHAVKGDPGHDLGMGEMSAPATDLPDSIVRLLPYRLKMRDERAFQRPARFFRGEAGLAGDIEGVQHLAVNVELNLPRRPVADAHGRRPFIARQPGYFEFRQSAFAGHAIHDL